MHGDRRSGSNAAGYADGHLVLTSEFGVTRFTKGQGFGHPAADGHLRRDNASVNQDGAIDFQGLSSDGRVVGRNNLMSSRR